jgi:hypothetical protein
MASLTSRRQQYGRPIVNNLADILLVKQVDVAIICIESV